MTVLFSDIRQFTRLSARMGLGETFAFVNHYLGRMVPAIEAHHGIVDKYVGDAIMALFPRQADDALDAAVAMLHALAKWNESLAAEQLPPLQIGVGLHYGQVMMGMVGVQERMDCTVIGDAVNVASRIEGATRAYGLSLLLTSQVRGRLEFPNRFSFEFLREGVVFISETGSRLLTGRAERLVARYLDGSLTLDRIIERLHSEVSAAEVCFVVERLKRDGVVVSGPRLDTPERGWEVLGAQPETVGHLREAEIEIVSVGDVGASAVETVAAMVRGLGARIVSRSIASAAESSTPGVFTIVVVDDYLRNALDGINAASLASGRPWLLVKPIGVQAWVGPFFTPGETGCWQCVAQRLRGHRRVDEYLRQRRAADDVATVPLADLPGVTSAAAGFAATAVGKWFVVGRSGLEGALWVFDSATMDWRRHRLVKRPQCPVCGDVARPVATDEGASRQASKANASLQLVARRCGIVDGGFRVASPEQTFERLKHHISPLTGIVSALVDLSDEAGAGRAVGPNFLAHHAFTTGATDVDELRDSLQRAAGGKGLTAAQAPRTRRSPASRAGEQLSEAGRIGGYRHEPVGRRLIAIKAQFEIVAAGRDDTDFERMACAGARIRPLDCRVFAGSDRKPRRLGVARHAIQEL